MILRNSIELRAGRGLPGISPKSVPNLELWVTANTGFTPSSWADQSGFGRNPSQGTAANQPSLSTAPGFNTVLFDGVNDNMSVAFALAQPQTIICCISPLASGALSAYDGFGNLRMSLRHNNATADTLFAQGGATSGVQNVPNVPNGTYRVWTAVFNGATSFLRQNGTVSTSGNINLAEGGLTAGGVFLGSQAGGVSFLNMELAEFCVYSRALSSDEMLGVERRIGRPRGVPVA